MSLSFTNECENKAKELVKHILAILKVGKENGMSKSDIEIHLEHHGIQFEDYNISQALSRLPESTDAKSFNNKDWENLYYLRESNESRDYGWY